MSSPAFRPATYTSALNQQFLSVERKGLVLAGNQRATLDISVTPGSVSRSITVTTQAPLLDTADASLVPMLATRSPRHSAPNRSFFGLGFSRGASRKPRARH